MSLLVAILGLAFLIVIHEAGHFVAAKAVGMRATKFYLGFPPALVKRTFGGTEYGIGAVLLGGYVRIVGMSRPRPRDLRSVGEAVAEARTRRPEGVPDRLTPAFERVCESLGSDDMRDAAVLLDELGAALAADAGLVDPERMGWCRRELERVRDDVHEGAYWRQAPWRRIVAIAAGPAANVLAALAILWIFFSLGMPRFTITNGVDVVLGGSPAQHVGLRQGDRVIAVNGTRTPTSDAVRTQIHRGGPVTLTVVRAGRHVTLGPVRPQRSPDCGGRPCLGFQFAAQRDGTTSYGPLRSLQLAWDDLRYTTTGTFAALRDRVTGRPNAPQFTSVVGIVQQSTVAVHAGVYPRMLALISLSLAIFNLLPFLPLDGGHILFTLIEAVRRRPLRREVYERVSLIGLAAMLTLFLFALHNDVGNIANGPHFSR